MCLFWYLPILCFASWSNARGAETSSCPSTTNFSSTFPHPYAVLKEKAYQEDDSDGCEETNDFATIVDGELRLRLLTHRMGNSDNLRELMIRGFQLLCVWTRPLKEKLKFTRRLKEAQQSYRVPNIPSGTADYYSTDIYNLTVHGWPIRNEKLTVDATDLRCPTIFRTTYEADSNTTTICGSIRRINDTSSTEFILTYRNVRITVKEKKTRAQKGRILGQPIRQEFSFASCAVRTTRFELPVRFVLDVLNARLIGAIFENDPSHRLQHASLAHNAKIAETYKHELLRLMCRVFIEYAASEYATPYRLPNFAFATNDTLQLTIEGLDKSRICASNMRIVERERRLSMRLIFSLNVPDNSNDTRLVVQRSSSPFQTVFILVQKLIARLEFSTTVEADDVFHLVDVSAQLVEKRSSSTAYQKYASRVHAALSEAVRSVVLTWMLYESNL